MNAQIVPPYPTHPEDEVGQIHIECRACGIEWAWARDTRAALDRLTDLMDDHNVQFHNHRRLPRVSP